MSCVPPVRVLHSQHAKRAAGPGLEQNRVLQLPHVMQGIAEPGCVIGVHGPIGRIGRFTSCNPGPGDVGYVRNGWLVQSNLVHLLLEMPSRSDQAFSSERHGHSEHADK